MNSNNFSQLVSEIKRIGYELGFNQIGITDLDLTSELAYLQNWLAKNFHGEMNYLRNRPAFFDELNRFKRAICCTINYPQSSNPSNPIASFALLDDYPSFIKSLLEKYVKKISNTIKDLKNVRIFSGDSRLMEKAFAAKSGVGFYGKNSLIITKDSGSYVFIGIILVDIELPVDKPLAKLCGECQKCINSCPTKAIVAPYTIDARRCISYLTIEKKGSIPIEFRELIGTRIFGCDCCQSVCPYNHLDNRKTLFSARNIFLNCDLAELFLWDEKTFFENSQNSPIRRLGYERWLRNIAVALGNSLPTEKNITALKSRKDHPSIIVQEHTVYALQKLMA